MELVFAPKDILQIDDVRIIYRNFTGRGDKFNREGDRNFAVVIPNEEIADALIEQGWKVKIKPPRDADEDPFMFMPVKIKYTEYSKPKVFLVSGASRVKLDENTIEILDNIDIERVDMDIRPYDWEVNGNAGRTAYLQSMEVVQRVDRFSERWAENER